MFWAVQASFRRTGPDLEEALGIFAFLDCQFGRLRGLQELLKQKTFVVAGGCNHPSLLVLPFTLDLIRAAV